MHFCMLILLSFILDVAPASAAVEGHSSAYSDMEIYELPLKELLQIPIISASMFSETSWTTTSSVAQANPQDWRQRGARRLTDAIEHLPNTVVLPFRFGANAVAIRGFAGSNLPRGTSLTLDSVPLTGFSNGAALVSLPNFELAVLDNIEVVRGPASALYGSDAFFGVVALSTEGELRARNRALVELSSNDYFQLGGRVAQPLDASRRILGGFSMSGQGDQQRHYTYTHPQTGDTATGFRDHAYDSQTAFLKYASDDVDTRSVKLGVYWNNFDADRFPGPGRSQTPTNSALGGQDWSGSHNDFMMVNALASQLLSPGIIVELKSFVWRADVEQYTKIMRAEGVGENHVAVGDTRYGAQVLLRSADSMASTQWAFALGQDHFRVHEGHLRAFAADASILIDADGRYKNETRHIDSARLEVKTALFDDQVRLVYGGRVDHYDDFGTQEVPRLGIILQANPQWLFKLLYGKAFRVPTAFEVNGIGNFRGNPSLDPEIIDTFEGVTMVATANGYVALTVFYSLWQDAISRVAIDDPVYRLGYRNSEKNKSSGLEISYRFEESRWWIDANAAYTESKNISNDVAYGAFPKAIFNAGWGYKSTQKHFRMFLNSRLLLNMQEGVNDGEINVDDLASYWRVDFNVEKQLNSHTNVFLSVHNLLNKDNSLPSLFNAENGVPDAASSISAGLRYTL